MKKKLVSAIVTVVFVMVSLLSTGVTVFAQSEEINQKVLEILIAIDEANQRAEKVIVMPEELRDIVQQIGEAEERESAELLGNLEYVLDIVELIELYNTDYDYSSEGGIIGFVQAYADYISSMKIASEENTLTENEIDAVRSAGFKLSDSAIQAFTDEIPGAVTGMISGYNEEGAFEKIKQLVILVKILTQFKTKMKSSDIESANTILENCTEWGAYLDCNFYDSSIPDDETPMPLNTPTPTDTITPTPTPTDESEIHWSSGDSHLSDAEILRYLESYTSTKAARVTKVGLSWCTMVTDISPMIIFTNLRYFDIRRTGITDVSLLKHFTKLEYVNIMQNGVDNISGFENLSNLKKLELHYTKVDDLSPIENLTNLEELDLFNNQISDIAALKNLTNLKKLILGGNRIHDISALKNLKNLTELHLVDNLYRSNDWIDNQIDDISVLENLTNLEKLDLCNSQISDISAIKNLTNLKKLNLGGDQIDDISALGNLTNLEELDLRNNQITDISVLSNMTNLSTLKLDNNPINNETTPNAVHKSELDFTVGDKTYEVWVVEEPVEIIKGDIDGNGVFNSIDFAIMKMYLDGTKNDLTEDQLEAADVDSNGAVNSIDFAIMRQVILGIKSGF